MNNLRTYEEFNFNLFGGKKETEMDKFKRIQALIDIIKHSSKINKNYVTMDMPFENERNEDVIFYKYEDHDGNIVQVSNEGSLITNGNNIIYNDERLNAFQKRMALDLYDFFEELHIR